MRPGPTASRSAERPRTAARRARTTAALALAAALCAAALAADPLADYRRMLADDNPAELTVTRGQELWQAPRGPSHVSLAACDLGLGPGVVHGAAAALPRWFDDAGLVMDLESRLVHCLVTIQGFSRAELVQAPFSPPGAPQTDLEALAAYVASESRGATIHVPQQRPAEVDSYQRGRALFFRRAGPYDFSCASCHGADGLRIRLQQLPNLASAEGARTAFAHWPAYRVSQGAVRTMQWRMADCVRQERLPELLFVSPASIDLITYLGVLADGGTMDAPSLRR
jgi:sulfur-oxidizing protein SoxA